MKHTFKILQHTEPILTCFLKLRIFLNKYISIISKENEEVSERKGDTTIFHTLGALLKIHNYGKKPTFPCHLQQMSQGGIGQAT